MMISIFCITLNFTKMKNPDFQGIYKYKLVMPMFFVVNALLFFFGPSLCPNFTQILYFVWTFFIAMKTLHMSFFSFFCLYQNKRVLRRLQNQINLKLKQGSPEILHAIIIPNYNEPMEVIKQTLVKLSKHSRATQNYFIYLAMQKNELNGERKAQKFINDFTLLFRNIDFTVHELQPHEYPSKAANVNWCSRQLEEKFKQMNQNIENCFLTIIDADAELPQLYFIEMEDHIRKNWDQKFTFVFGPFNIFNKNHLNVPAVTRVFDHLVSSFQMSNIVNLTGFGFAISNYSASYNLVKRIDFWDTNEECITEDLHFMQKVCWRTEGEMKTVPIFVPANEMSIETGHGYWEDFKAKFWTSQRHFRSCNQIAYSLRMFFNTKFNWKTFRMVLIVLDTLALQAFYPIVMFAMAYHKSILTSTQQGDLLISHEKLDFVAMLSVLGVVSFMVNYQIISRRSNEKIFGNKNRQWYKSFEFLILLPVAQYLVLFPANVYAIFGSLKTNRTWFMARNKSNDKKE